jgi:spermidine/putrescine transport system substrate-binding protein
MQPILANGESGGRSLMVASDALAKKEYDLGYIQQLDKSALKAALDHLAPVASQGGDPDHTYSIPWQGGMTGLIVNEKLAPTSPRSTTSSTRSTRARSRWSPSCGRWFRS